MAYTGPIPPTPTAASTDAQWASWWAYQTVLTNGRYDDERAARAVITDKQHAEKMLAEDRCAASNSALAAAQQAQADSIRYMVDHPESKKAPWTDEDLVRSFLIALSEGGVTGVAALSKARTNLLAYRMLYPAPEVAP